jgi:hypothetical protein
MQQLRPKQEANIRQATQNNMEPSAFSLGGGFSNVVSDSYSFLDSDPDALKATGNGGTRQMHNYVDLNFSDQINTPLDEAEYKKASKLPSDLTLDQLQQQRDQDFQKVSYKTK